MAIDKLKDGFGSHVLDNLDRFLACAGLGRALGVYSTEVKARPQEAISIVAAKIVTEFSASCSVSTLPRLLAMLTYITDLDQAQHIPQSLHSLIIRILLVVKIDPKNMEQMRVYKELFFCIRDRNGGWFPYGVINEIRWRVRYGMSYNVHGDIPSEMPAEGWLEVIRAYCVKRTAKY